MDSLNTKPISALENQLVPGHFGANDKTGVIVTEVSDFSLLQIAAWPESITQVAGLAASSIAKEDAPGPGQSIRAEAGELLRIEPLKWWHVEKKREKISHLKLNPEQGSVLDISHSRTWLVIKGDKAAALLNHFLPIDLRPANLPNGSVISTAFHHVGVTLYYQDEEFNLFLPRSFALSLWEMLYESSLQYGLEVKAANS